MVENMKLFNTIRTNFLDMLRDLHARSSVRIKCAPKLNHCISVRPFTNQVWINGMYAFFHSRTRNGPMIDGFKFWMSFSKMKISSKILKNPIDHLFICISDTYPAHVMGGLRFLLGMIDANIKASFAFEKTCEVSTLNGTSVLV